MVGASKDSLYKWYSKDRCYYFTCLYYTNTSFFCQTKVKDFSMFLFLFVLFFGLDNQNFALKNKSRPGESPFILKSEKLFCKNTPTIRTHFIKISPICFCMKFPYFIRCICYFKQGYFPWDNFCTQNVLSIKIYHFHLTLVPILLLWVMSP